MRPGTVNRPTGTGDYLFMHFHTPVQAGCSEPGEWLAPDTLWIWEPGDGQFYGNRRDAYLHTWLHCDGQLVARLLGKIPRRTPLCLGSALPFEKLIIDLNEEISANLPADGIIIGNLLENWFRDVARRINGVGRQAPERLARVREFIDARCDEVLTLEQLARMTHWSIAHFSEEFRRFYGVAPYDYVIRQRMHRAVYLLRDVNQSITEIARAVGYEDLYHFSKLFKRHIGMSPREARKVIPAEKHRGQDKKSVK
jgi:AraC-like DNA-binding protein